MNNNGEPWFEDYAEDADELEVEEYDITVSPNDFNVMTLYSFIESGAVSIPSFQRTYVWDLARASKLIESLIRGLPVPQLFLYEQERNKFLVIDGQQRLMSIYYFKKGRFPKKKKRVKIRSIFDRAGRIPESILHDDTYFQDFKLRLHARIPNYTNKLNGLNYATLGDYKTQFDLRPIRNIVVRQNLPANDDSSIYEIFNRLNTGGVTLSPQEIRTSMYHSNFDHMLYEINNLSEWRRILGLPEPELHMRDIEILLRGFAMLIDGENYAPSMVKFLNQFANKCKGQKAAQNAYCKDLFNSFLLACSNLPDNAFKNKKSNRFNVALYEAVFTTACKKAFAERRPVAGKLTIESLCSLENDSDFSEASRARTTHTLNVRTRLERAREIVGPLNVGAASDEHR